MEQKHIKKYDELTEKILDIATPAQRDAWNSLRSKINYVQESLKDLSITPSLQDSQHFPRIRALEEMLDEAVSLIPVLSDDEEGKARMWFGREKEDEA